MRIKSLFTIILWLGSSGILFGLEDNLKCHRSTEGTEFWFGFMQGRKMNAIQNRYVEITVVSRENTTFSIYIGKNATPYNNQSYALTGNTPLQIRIPYSQVEPTVSESVLEMGIHLVSDRPVNVYAYNHDDSSADAAVIYPVGSLGNKYFTICYTPHVHSDLNHGKNSEFVIVASQDNTRISITPSETTDQGNLADKPFEIILNKGELYQVQSQSNDLTGSYISSDKPVAVYAGSFSTTIPVSATGGWDQLYEQMPPVDTWGREYYTVPLLTRSKDYFRVLASQDKTLVDDGTTRRTLNQGEFWEFTLTAATRIVADKPVLMAQYSQSRNNDNVRWGDGSMVILSSISQVKNDVTFMSYAASKIYSWYINVVVPISEIDNMELGGVRLSGSNFKAYANNRFAYAQLTVPSGASRLRNAVHTDHGFIAYAYGFGDNEAYSYGVGFNLDLVLDLGKSIDFEGDTIPRCKGTTAWLDAGPYFDYYRWDSGDTTQQIVASKQGKYAVTAWTIDGCKQRDSIFVLINDPKVNIGRDTSGCSPFSLQLDAGSGFYKYEWNTGENSQKITVDSTGQYRITVSDKYECLARDTMNFTVFPVPKVVLDGKSLLCGTQTGTVTVNYTGTPEEVWKTGTPFWETAQSGKLDFTGSSLTGTGYAVKEWGDYEIRYTLTTKDGCTSRDTFRTGLFQTPVSSFIFPENPDDKCKGYSREILYTGNASPDAQYYWNFGGSTLIARMEWNLYRVSIGAFNSNPFITLVVEENGCWSDTTRKPIGANPDFIMNTLKSRGCDSATIYFSGELKVPDSLLFVWDFGDGSPYSYQQNPSHKYTKVGNYDVKLDITNQLTGCKIGFLIDDMVKIFPTPIAEMSADPGICYGDTIPLIYTRNIDSSLCTWHFEGATPISGENDSIWIRINTPVAKIGLQVNEYGCLSKPVEKFIKRKPDFDFFADNREDCQPMDITLTTGTSDSGLTYAWQAGNQSFTGDKQLLRLDNPGKVTVVLTAKSSETGCTRTITKQDWIMVHPKPVSSFTVDYPVALLEHANLQFTDSSLLAERYRWDFGDGGMSSEKNPRHQFTSLGKFTVAQVVLTDFGCPDTSLMTIEILPFNVFTPNAFRPDSDIPVNREFMPVYKGVDPQLFHMLIFNRWGEVVFESRSPDDPWTGKLKNGREAPMGNYVWRADYTDIQGYKHSRKGQILLIR